MTEFLAMGGYAQYVWPTYGLTLIVVVINVVAARRRLRSVREALALKAARERRRRSQA
ncbi:MAG: heme exporter protein CcmD [Gammaproteobacteria bacterium]|nr:MAG: heme exporter protein CcmD [Gammaproteobacteria bacterium]